MKLKYYLRGLGVGMLVTALVFIFVIIPNRQKMTDDEIKEAALKLGMQDTLPKDSTVPDTLGTPTPVPNITSGNSSEHEDAPAATPDAAPTVDPAMTSDAVSAEKTGTESSENPSAESDSESGEVSSSEPGHETDEVSSIEPGHESGEVSSDEPDSESSVTSSAEQDNNSEAESSEGSDSEGTDNENQGESGASTVNGTVEVEIYRKMTSEQLSADLFEKGLIDDAAEFNRFLITNRYADALKIGTYNVPAGLTYKELAKLLSNR